MPIADKKTSFDKQKYYTTQQVADITGVSQTTLTLWIRNKMIDDSKIKRDKDGHRLWSEEDIQKVLQIKKMEGWK